MSLEKTEISFSMFMKRIFVTKFMKIALYEKEESNN